LKSTAIIIVTAYQLSAPTLVAQNIHSIQKSVSNEFDNETLQYGRQKPKWMLTA
jgi:hypothetical protein